MPHEQMFACPNCATPLVMGVSACERCQIRLTGPEAVRLWEVDQHLGTLAAERGALIAALTASGVGAPAVGAAPTPAGIPFQTSPYPLPGHQPTRAKKSISGQQVLLGLGALMLLSAASFFLLIVWFVVGVAGQALIMVVLTGAAVASSVWATRRGLPAVAETAAILATGFLVLDLSAAHVLGLAGLDEPSFASYWSGAAVVGGGLLVWWDRLVPTHLVGDPLRRILTYRPAAAVLFAAAPWFWFTAGRPEGSWLCAAMLAVALVNFGCGLVALRVDHKRVAQPVTTAPSGGPARTGVFARIPVSAIIFFVSAALAVAAYALTGLSTAYDLAAPGIDRYPAFALLLLTPAALAVLSTRVATRITAPLGLTQSTIPAFAVASGAVVLGVPLMDATFQVVVGVSVLVAAAVTGQHLGLVKATTETGQAGLRAVSIAAYAAQPLFFAVVFVLVHDEQRSLRAMLAFDDLPSTIDHPSVLWTVIPAAVWAASSTVGTVRRRSSMWAFINQAAVAASLVAALWETHAQTWSTVLLIAFAITVALACLAVRRGSHALIAPKGTPVVGDPFWAGVDRVAILFAALYAAGAVVAASELTAGHLSFTLVSIGVLIVVYAAAPARLPFAYVGSLFISAGTANLMREAAVETTEAYTAPLVLLLAAIGFVQWSRDKTLPTYLTMGPALSVAFGPSLLTSLEDGDELRLAGVTAAAIAVLLVGLMKRWKAPVSAGGLVLIVVAITQGGPLIGYVNGWIILGGGGVALLAAGFAWERAVVAGRRAGAWFNTLR